MRSPKPHGITVRGKKESHDSRFSPDTLIAGNKMSWPIPSRQKNARKALRDLFDESRYVRIIHYSCESFYDRPEGRSPRVTSIAIRRLDSGQTVSFSIHKIAEEKRIAFNAIEENYDALEKEMLINFYQHVGIEGAIKYLHWNMRDGNYGFAAIAHRAKLCLSCA